MSRYFEHISFPLTDHLDTLKLYTKAHGSKVGSAQTLDRRCRIDAVKTSNLIINLDHDEYILGDDNATLASCGTGMLGLIFSLNWIVNSSLQRMRRRLAFSTGRRTKHSKLLRRYETFNIDQHLVLK